MQRTNSSNAIPHRKKDEEFTARFSSMRVDSPCNSPCSSPKTRKPYSVSKSREVWTPDEHQRFIEALKLYQRDWKQIEKYVGTKTVIQIRSHAQKYFLKLQKSNSGERIPPPRPKRPSPKTSPRQTRKNDSPCSSPPTPSSNKVNITQIHPSECSMYETFEPICKSCSKAVISEPAHFIADVFECHTPPIMLPTSVDISTTTTSTTEPLCNSLSSPQISSPPTGKKSSGLINFPTTPLKQEEIDSAENMLLNLPSSWSSETNTQNPVVNHPQIFSQWMALNSYLFGATFANFYPSSTAEIQRMMFEQIQKAQHLVNQAIVYSNQQANFDSFMSQHHHHSHNGELASLDLNLDDDSLLGHGRNLLSESKGILPNVLNLGGCNTSDSPLSNSTLHNYSNLLGKQMEFMKQQMPQMEDNNRSFQDSNPLDPASDLFLA